MSDDRAYVKTRKPASAEGAPIEPMNHEDHVLLIAVGIDRDQGDTWADFGAGRGAFTLALRELTGPDAEIVAVDADCAALRDLSAAMERRFPATRLRLLPRTSPARSTCRPSTASWRRTRSTSSAIRSRCCVVGGAISNQTGV
jgi:precorrin-6B methylase 2